MSTKSGFSACCPHLFGRSFLTPVIDHLGSFVSILGLPLTALVAKNDIVIVIVSIRTLKDYQTESLTGSVTLGSLSSALLGL